MIDRNILEKIFNENDISAVIDFAAYKAVGESVQKPVEYYTNNVSTVLVLLSAMKKYNVKNYTEQGGEKTVIGGTLEIKEGAELAGFPKAENQADSTATTISDLKSDFNDLLSKLKAAGLMVQDE